jgi:large subunit ribosomal protein L13
MKTSFLKPAKSQWYLVDATDKPVGRISSKIAHVLRGRHRASFVPHWPAGDHVIVVNIEKAKLTGSKTEQKKYYRHAGYLGHLRTSTAKELKVTDPSKIIVHAVKGMLPKNPTRQHMMRNLHLFVGPAHTHEAQKPVPFPF